MRDKRTPTDVCGEATSKRDSPLLRAFLFHLKGLCQLESMRAEVMGFIPDSSKGREWAYDGNRRINNKGN